MERIDAVGDLSYGNATISPSTSHTGLKMTQGSQIPKILEFTQTTLDIIYWDSREKTVLLFDLIGNTATSLIE